MKQNNKGVKSRQKRKSLATLKNAGIASVALGSMGTQWMKPVVSQVILPAHAETTRGICAANITATLQQCSEGGSIVIEISSDSESLPLRIESVPNVTPSPAVTYQWPGGNEVNQGTWDISDLDPLPADITPDNSYSFTIAGPVTDFNTCWPATDIPNENGQALSSIVVAASLLCESGTTVNLSEDIISQLTPCPCI